MTARRRLSWVGIVLAGTLAGGQAQAKPFVEPCVRSDTFPIPLVSGAYDYRNQRAALVVVESNHYSPLVENLIRGRTGTVASEHSFVLHAFPNHHRALASLSRYALREKSQMPGNLDYTVDCYFQRALLFRPDDHIVRMLFADYLGRTNREADAAAQLDYVRGMAGDNPLTHYNAGLLYLQIGRTTEALAQAHRAAELGVPRTELRDKLKALGKWTEPSAAGSGNPAPPSAPASAAPASSPGQ